MTATEGRKILQSEKLPRYTIWFLAIIFIATNFSHHNWVRVKPEHRGVINNDIAVYYSYLTAAFIEKDLSLEFIEEPGFQNDYRFWDVKTENGNRLIITSMGLAFLYLPFFLLAHLLAHVFGLSTDGYGSIYQFFLVFGSLVYVLLAFQILKNLLRKYFSARVTALTLLLVGIGTNLYYYTTYEASMSHSYNFFLMILFTWRIIRWYGQSDWRNALIIGLLLGLISLIRPTNILVFFVLLLWGVNGKQSFIERVVFYLKKWYLVAIMIAGFIIAWSPQMIYWKMVAGKFLYFSYGAAGASFYFLHPHIMGSLFSYLKGWYVYTPVMLVATLGILPLRKRIPGLFLPVFILWITMVYVQSSWWSWWFGGGYGLRAYIDIYGLMAFPLAVMVENILNMEKRVLRYSLQGMLALLLMLSIMQTYQYKKTIMYYCGMTKETYWTNFFRFTKNDGYLEAFHEPDHNLARLGIYYFYDISEDHSELLTADAETEKMKILEVLNADRKLMKEISRYAERENISIEEGLQIVAGTIYQNMYSKAESR